MMALRELVEGLPIAGEVPTDLLVSGVEHDSRRVEEGDLFVAVRGALHDGREFAPEAVASGARAVVAEGPPVGPEVDVPWLRTSDTRAVLGPLAARITGHPDRELTTIGVTGTNGKSTTVWLVREILDAAGVRTARLGSLGTAYGEWVESTERTTPEAPELFEILARLRDEGAGAVVMEVSSHALAQERVGGMSFDVAVFTNLSRDHLDFHADLDEYFAAKRSLFDRLAPGGRAVVNVGDDWGRTLAAELPDAMTFGDDGEVVATRIELDLEGIELTVATPRGELEIESRLRGRYNVENILAAVAVTEALGISHQDVVAGIGRLPPVPGRLEPIEAGQEFPVFVDFAHTPAALGAAIEAVREITGRSVVVVFGCGGDRDPGKREPMGRVAGAAAELPIITSDNPRSEDPLAIIAAVETGVRSTGNERYRVIPDRREAIRRAISVAGPEWAVLVAGKGSEEYQIGGDERRRFSDREEIVRAVREIEETEIVEESREAESLGRANDG